MMIVARSMRAEEMNDKTIFELKERIKSNADNLLMCREKSAKIIKYAEERDCAEAVEHYCRALNYLSQIEED